MADNVVKFKYGTLAQYNALLEKDNDTLYFITDAHLVFKGVQNVTSRTVVTQSAITDTYGQHQIQLHDNLTGEDYFVYNTQSVIALLQSVQVPTATDTVQGINYLSDTPDITKDVTQATAATPAAVQGALQYAIDYANNLLGANDAMVFKGMFPTTSPSFTQLPAAHETGWTYRVSEAGYVSSNGTWSSDNTSGEAVEAGDLIICIADADGTTANTMKDWTIAQTNIDGAVIAAQSLTLDQLVVGAGGHGIKTLAAGTEGYILGIDNGIPTWIDPTNVSVQWEPIA